MKTQVTISEQLWNVVQNEPRSIRCCVAKEALEYGDNPTAFFKDLAKHGCISGMVNSLILYRDTYKFFDEYYGEIEEIRAEIEVMSGTPVTITGDLKNFFAWLAFEQNARYMMFELGIE